MGVTQIGNVGCKGAYASRDRSLLAARRTCIAQLNEPNPLTTSVVSALFIMLLDDKFTLFPEQRRDVLFGAPRIMMDVKIGQDCHYRVIVMIFLLD